LSVVYESDGGNVLAVDRAHLKIQENEFVAVVGESGCGKSTLALSVIGLLPSPPAKVTNGSVQYKGTNLVSLDQEHMREYRGTEIAMIFQEPLSSLNPVYRIGYQIAEAIVVRELRKRKSAPVKSELMQKTYGINSPRVLRPPKLGSRISAELREEIIDALKLVRIADPEQVLERYPFELSGGMRQRVMIAMTLSQRPALLIADEPTTALDVTTQAQVLKLMKELMDEVKTSILLITHDLAVASQVADRVVVMYAGEVVEDASVFDMFATPFHPYTRGLLSCIPSSSKDEGYLKPISGTVPDLREDSGRLSTACKFEARCPYAMKVCSERRPTLIEGKPNHKVACFLYGE
jgi:oligopeptide/dipeptide ABC transporter ATP-binding protein